MPKTKVIVCTKGKTCRKQGARAVFCALEEQIERLGLDGLVKLKKADCLGNCGNGPTVQVKPAKVCYGSVGPEDCGEIIRSLGLNSQPAK